MPDPIDTFLDAPATTPRAAPKGAGAGAADPIDAFLDTPEAGAGEWAGYNLVEGGRDLLNLPTDTIMFAGSLLGSDTAQDYLKERQYEQADRQGAMLDGRLPPSDTWGEALGGAARSGPSAGAALVPGTLAVRAGMGAAKVAAAGAIPGAITSASSTTGRALAEGADPLAANARGTAAGVLEVAGEVLPIPGLGRGADVALARALAGNAPGQRVGRALATGGKDVVAGGAQEAWVNPAQSVAEASMGGAGVTLESLADDATTGFLTAGVLGAPMAVTAGGASLMAQQKTAALRQQALEARIAQRKAAEAKLAEDTMVEGLADTMETADVAEAVRADAELEAVARAQMGAEAPDPDREVWTEDDRLTAQIQGLFAQDVELENAIEEERPQVEGRKILADAEKMRRIREDMLARQAEELIRDVKAGEKTLQDLEARTADGKYARAEREAIQDEARDAEDQQAKIEARLEKAQALMDLDSDRAARKRADAEAGATGVELAAEQATEDAFDRAEREAIQTEPETPPAVDEPLPEPEALSPEHKAILLDAGYTRSQLRKIKPALAERIIREKGLTRKAADATPAPVPAVVPATRSQPAPAESREATARETPSSTSPVPEAGTETTVPTDTTGVVGEAQPQAEVTAPAEERSATDEEAGQEADEGRQGQALLTPQAPATPTPQKREQAWREQRARLHEERAQSRGRFTATKGDGKKTVRARYEAANVADIDALTAGFGPAPTPQPITAPGQGTKPHPFYHYSDWVASLPPEAHAEIAEAMTQGKEARYEAQAKWGWTKDHATAADLGRKHELNDKGMVRMQADPITGSAEARDTPAFKRLEEIAAKHYGYTPFTRQTEIDLRQKPSKPGAMTTADVKDLPRTDPLEYSPEQHAVTRAIKAVGGRVQIVEGLKDAGAWGVYWFDGQPHVLIDSKATGAQLASAAAHEATHLAFDAIPPGAQDQVWEAVTAAVGTADMARLIAETKARHAGENLSERQLQHEVLAAIGERLDLVKLADHAPGFVEKVVEILSDMLRNLVARFTGDARVRGEPIIRAMLRRQIAMREAVHAQWAAGPDMGRVLGVRQMPAGARASKTPNDLGENWKANTLDYRDAAERAVLSTIFGGKKYEAGAVAWLKNTHDVLRIAQEHPEMWAVYDGVREATGRSPRVAEDVHVAARDLTRASEADAKVAAEALHAADGTGSMADTAGMSEGAAKAVDAFYAARDVFLRQKAQRLRTALGARVGVFEAEPGDEFDTSELDADVARYDDELKAAEHDLAMLKAAKTAKTTAAYQEAAEQIKLVKELGGAEAAAKRRLSGMIREVAALNDTGYIPHYWSNSTYAITVGKRGEAPVERRTADTIAERDAIIAEMTESYGPEYSVTPYSNAEVTEAKQLGVGARLREDLPMLTEALSLTPEQIKSLEETLKDMFLPKNGRAGTQGYITDLSVVAARMAGAAGHAGAQVIIDTRVDPTIDSMLPSDMTKKHAEAVAKREKARVKLALATGEVDAADAQARMASIDAGRTAAIGGGMPQLASYAKQYVSEATTGNPAAVQMGRWMANILMLGGRVSSAVLQLVQPIAQTSPFAANFGANAAWTSLRESKSVLRVLRLHETGQFFRSRAEIDKVMEKMIAASGDADLADAMRDNLRRGRNFELPTEAEFKDLEASAKGEKPSKVRKAATAAAEKSMAFFSAADMAVRVSSYRTGWRIGKQMDAAGWRTAKHLGYHGDANPAAFAEWFTDRTAFVMGKANQAQAQRSNVGQLLTSLKSYPLNVLNVYRSMRAGRAAARRAGDTESLGRQRAALAAQLITHTLISGPAAAGPMLALAGVAVNLVSKIIAAATGDDRGVPWTWQAEVYRRLGQDSTFAKFMDQGVPGVIGTGNLGRRLGWSAGAVPEDPSLPGIAAPLAAGWAVAEGAVGAVEPFTNPALSAAEATQKAMQSLAAIPRAGKDVGKAIGIAQGRGVDTAAGKPVGAVGDYGAGALLSAATGFQTQTEQEAAVARGVNSAIGKANTKAQRQFASALSAARRANDWAKMEKIKAEMRKYNEGKDKNARVSIPEAMETARGRAKMAEVGSEDVKFAPMADREAIRATE